jgi:hypothetical protein
MLRIIIALTTAWIALSSAAVAQSVTPDAENGRYTFKETRGEFLRLDGRTGQVSLCSKSASGWACMSVPDERTALETEIGRLQGENAALKKELLARTGALPGAGKSADSSAGKPDESTLKLPSDAEFEKVMTFMEKVWRRLVTMVQKMQKEMDKS